MFTYKYRKSTDILTPGIWYVYKDFGTGNPSDWELVKSCQSRPECVRVIKKLSGTGAG